MPSSTCLSPRASPVLIRCILALIAWPLLAAPVPVFILAGQSNMQGQGVVDMDHPTYYNGGKGTLQHVMARPGNAPLYAHLKDAQCNWRVRDDVFIRFQRKNGIKAGGLSIGYTGYDGSHHIGPELQFGHEVGDAFDEPVLLIKTAWGGKSLYADFRPPSADGETGPYYAQMIAGVREALATAADDFPALAGHELQIRGFVWMQGWNDMFNADGLANYAENLRHLVHDIRTELALPTLPVVVGELGNLGDKAGKNMKTLRTAQKTAAESMPGVSFVPTAIYARPAEESPNVGHGHHWFGNAESYYLIGGALGRSMLELLGKPPADRNFIDWDSNADGRLVQDELPQRLRKNFARVDRDASGFISLQEHLAVGAKRQLKVQHLTDLPYANSANPRQRLDLLLPTQRKSDKPLPVVAFIHGGAWRAGNKDAGIKRVMRFAESGEFAAASIGYRLSGEAKWPAQIQDCKAAIAWLKSQAATYNLDPDRIAVFGSSAGGHLVSMLGVTGGEKGLGDPSVRVAAVVDFFGPTDFLTMNDHPGRMDHDAADSPESQLIDGPIQEHKERARLATPMAYISADDAPFLILHGTRDDLVPFPQSASFHAALTKAGVQATLVPVEGAGHGFGGPQVNAWVDAFLYRQLLGRERPFPSSPIRP
jgi:acetyl esterase/lipase